MPDLCLYPILLNVNLYNDEAHLVVQAFFKPLTDLVFDSPIQEDGVKFERKTEKMPVVKIINISIQQPEHIIVNLSLSKEKSLDLLIGIAREIARLSPDDVDSILEEIAKAIHEGMQGFYVSSAFKEWKENDLFRIIKRLCWEEW